jgi:hypothetical protein
MVSPTLELVNAVRFWYASVVFRWILRETFFGNGCAYHIG